MALSILTIVLIGVASLFLLIILGTVAVTYPMFRAHKKKLAELERQVIAAEIGPPQQCANITRPSIALRKSMQLANNASAGWGVLPSNEDLHDEYQKNARRRPEKRKSDLLPWPLPRRKSSKKKLSMKKIRATRLSTVVESPRTERTRSVFDDVAKGAMLEMSPDLNRVSFFPAAEEPTQGLQPRSRSASPGPNISPSEALRPAPLRLSKRGTQLLEPGEHRPTLDRAVTVPTILIATDDSIFGETRRMSNRQSRHSRSISFGQSSSAPYCPPPLLPGHVPRQLRPTPSLVRTISNDSVASSASVGSSLLQASASPNMRARNEFCQRHPEMGLAPQVREPNPDLKDALLSGQRNTEVSSSTRASPRMTSFTASLLGDNAAEAKRPRAEGDLGEVKQRVTASDVQMLASGGVDESSTTIDQQDPAIKVLSTPAERDSQTRKVSDSYGSPLPREKRSGTLRPISVNTQLPSRDASQTSLQSSDSSAADTNPFKWDTSSPQTQRQSVLKGSPNARKSHRRLNSVRISMTPTYYGPGSRSSSRMFEIAEEDGSSPNGPYDETSVVHPPSVPSFDPKLNNPTAYRASLRTESPALSMTEFKDSDNIFARYNSRNPSSSPDGRTSRASSVLSIPLFPTREDSSTPATSVSGFEEVRTYGGVTNFSKPARPVIPGLTTLQQNKNQAPEFQYPTINLANSPASSLQATPGSASKQVDSAPSPTELLDRALAAASTLPRSMSPPPKASPTTHVSQEQLCIPVSTTSSNPLDTKPDFSPHERAAAMPPHHPLGPRAPPAPSIMKTVKGLRRDNSEAFRSIDSSWTRRYFSIGRPPSNISANSLASSPILGNFRDVDDEDENEKENVPPRPTFEELQGRKWSDEPISVGAGMTKAEKRKGHAFETPSPKVVSRGKSVTWGPVEFSETPLGATPASLYDANGFYIGDGDGDSPC